MKKSLVFFLIVSGVFLNSLTAYGDSAMDQQLYQTALPYIKYFQDRSIQATDFQGFTRSFQLDLGGHSLADQAVINYGASSYDQTIIGRINLAGGSTTVLDTFVKYYKLLTDLNNPVLNCNGSYYDANNVSIKYGPYRIIRVLGRDVPNWWNTWDWIVDTGAASCLIVDAAEGYQKTLNTDYKGLAVLLGDYILKLQDTDGGIRYGPRGMYHDPEGLSDFYWNLKSTEQNERALYALEALFEITADVKYSQAALQIKSWLKDMYSLIDHMYHAAATFNGSTWIKSHFGYVATDVMAFAPFDLMFQDTFFGTTQDARDAEVAAMFTAIESRTAFLNAQGLPVFFRFSVSQTGDYGSVEMSSQMALAYLRVAQIYAARNATAKTEEYLIKYNTLVSSLETYFSVPSDDPGAKIAPYSSYLNTQIAGGVPTGTGYFTFNCQAALASAYYAFAKAGYMPFKLGGGSGIPATSYTLNMSTMPWYQNTAYSSTGAAAAQMILNYICEGAAEPLLTQDQIYSYARQPAALGGDLTADEVDKALGHFDPYDYLISNLDDGYDSLSDGNPYQGYNYTVDTYDPALSSEAINEYMRDICHWMAYTVTKESWWKDGELVARPNTPAAVPIYGTYDHWIVVKGYAASANPMPYPHTNPFYTPDFTVYGLWVKDPLASGIGKDTYKTAAECSSTYFLPLSSSDAYNGMYVQVAEPPERKSYAKVEIRKPREDLGNLDFIGVKVAPTDPRMPFQTTLAKLNVYSSVSKNFIKKYNWRDIVDSYLLSDPEAVAAFDGTKSGKAVCVRRQDIKGADYYLVPFGRNIKGNNALASGVIILDALDGHFKEASWTDKPEQFFQVEKNQAILLLYRYALNDYYDKIKKIKRDNGLSSLQQCNSLYKNYSRLLGYIYRSTAQLIWQPGNYSASPYMPYWRLEANGYVWYVTQDGKVFPEVKIEKIIEEIENSRLYLDKFFKKKK